MVSTGILFVTGLSNDNESVVLPSDGKVLYGRIDVVNGSDVRLSGLSVPK
jgi:hypothetical protein